MESIILIGGGGHCKSCIDVIETENRFKIAGILDIKEKIGQKVLEYPIIGCDDDIKSLISQYKNFFITLGQIKTPELRIKLFNKLKAFNCSIPIIISPFAYVSKHSQIEEGTIIMNGAFVNTGAVIGKNCIINTNSIIEHDSIINDYCHISTSTVINGGSKVGSGSFIGSGAVVREYTSIENNSFIKANSVVK